jgi:hypothetical protein
VHCYCALIAVVLGDKYFDPIINTKFLFRHGKEPTKVFGMLKQVYSKELHKEHMF